MIKELWINLPVKDVKKSREFWMQLGFTFSPRFSNGDNVAALQVGDKGIIVMLFPENELKKFTQNNLPDSKTTEVMFSMDAQSREEVDEFAKSVDKAGGNVFAPPSEIQGWMYGCAFADVDGHRWNMLYMDMSKMK